MATSQEPSFPDFLSISAAGYRVTPSYTFFYFENGDNSGKIRGRKIKQNCSALLTNIKRLLGSEKGLPYIRVTLKTKSTGKSSNCLPWPLLEGLSRSERADEDGQNRTVSQDRD